MNLLKRRILGLLLVITLLTSTTACSLTRPVRNTEDSSYKQSSYEQYTQADLKSQEAFNEFTDRWFLESVQENTIDLHYTIRNPEAFGITEHVPTLGTLNLDEFKKSIAEAKSALTELNEFSKENLTYEQQLTYDVLLNYLQTELRCEGLELYIEFLNPTTGIQSQLPVLFAEYQFYTEKDITDYLAILMEVDEYYAQIIEFEKVKSAAGLFMSDRGVDDLVKGCAAFIDTSEDNYLIQVFNDRIDAFPELSDETRNHYKEQNRIAVYEHVIPGYHLLNSGLEALKGTGINNQGLCNYERGKEYYEYLVASNVGTYRSMDDLLKMIQKYLERDLRKMSATMERQPTIAKDSMSFTYPLSDPTEILEDLKVKIAADFPALPETSFMIKYVHPSLEDSLSPAFYLTPPVDDSSGNVIYINNGRSQNKDSLFATLAHEGYPGHLYQNIYYNHVDTSDLRRYLSFTGYSEGWATYVEYHSYGYVDGMDSDMAGFLAANGSATLALYAYMDISINYYGWGIAETRDFLSMYYGIEDESVFENIFYTMVEEPTNYLKYYIGYLEILELRASMETQLNDKFVLKDFHEQLLNIGPAPFNVIESYMNDWARTVGS